jgi:sugar diacid utilization regulator
VPANVSHLPVPQGPDRHSAADASALDVVCEVVESGGGLLELIRAAGRALDSSLVLVDRSRSVLATAARSPAEERALVSGADDTTSIDLRVADEVVGQLRLRARGERPAPSLERAVAAIVALEVERVRGPDRAARAAAGGFLRAVLRRELTDRDEIVEQASELGVDIAGGGLLVVARAHQIAPVDEDWRARLLAVAERGASATAPGSVAALNGDEDGPVAEASVLVPSVDTVLGRRVAEVVHRELEANLGGLRFTVGVSRAAVDPADLHRAGTEGLLAANVADADAESAVLAFEETGAYRLLLPAMSEDPAELQRFFAETLEPVVAYDEQYETDLVQTLETYLDADGNVAGTAQKLFTHRHTVRYRLERVRELSGHDVGSSDGREKLSLGLKAMRVLGIPAPGGPATERGAEAGRVPRESKDRR